MNPHMRYSKEKLNTPEIFFTVESNVHNLRLPFTSGAIMEVPVLVAAKILK